MRWIVVLIPVLCAACSASIPLGSECPEIDGRCTRIGFGEDEDAGEPEDAGASDAGRALDASARDAASRDAAPGLEDAAAQEASVPDAQGDGAAPSAEWLLNGSFELQNDATAPASLSGFTRPSPIEPWYGCRGGMEAVAEATLTDGTKVHPTEGATFFVDSLYTATTAVSGLAQDLKTPLRAGQTYAFKVDLWSEPGLLQGPIELQVASGALRMWLGAVKCVLSGVTIIGHSGPIEPGGWRSSCVSFTAPAEISSITLMGGAIQQQILNVNFGARLFIDNVRVVPKCE